MTFASQLTASRKAHGLTQAELAQALGVTSQSVSNWECGRVEPWPKVQVEILLKLLQLAGEPPAVRIPETPAPRRGRVIDRI